MQQVLWCRYQVAQQDFTMWLGRQQKEKLIVACK